MGADLGALFEDADAELAPGFFGELLQTDGGGEARGAGADDHHVIRHGLAFGHFRLLSSQTANDWQINRRLTIDQPAPA